MRSDRDALLISSDLIRTMLFKTTKQIGNSGEDLACQFLRKQGYKILERNFRIRGGEIDIIAKDKETLVFVEVKLRYGHEYGYAREAVTGWKMHFLQRAALFYLTSKKLGEVPYRFDLVAIDIANNKSESIELIKNIS
jgi:putative endonuclease